MDLSIPETASFTRASNLRYSVHLQFYFKMIKHDLCAHTQALITTYYILKTRY